MIYENLIIESVEIYQSRIKLIEPFIISLGLFEYAENIIVIIRTDKGIAGFGECSPFMTVHGESMETCFIVGKYIAKILKGKNPLKIDECSKAMDMLIYCNSSIKSAFDIALYDIASQNNNQPLFRFLSGRNNKVLITDYTVSLSEADKMAVAAKKIMNNGFPVIKVKLGESAEADIERIRIIRETTGNEIPIRIDANQGWTLEEAIRVLNALQPYNIQHCEEPIARGDYSALSKVRRHSPIPVMADESCCDHHDAKRLIDLASCDLFNVKLGKSSGIYKAQKIIQLAENGGIKIQVGGFLESRLGFTASAHLALTSNNIIYYDFDTPLMLIEDHVIGGIVYGKNGTVTVPETAGLGASIDQKYLNTLIKAVI